MFFTNIISSAVAVAVVLITRVLCGICIPVSLCLKPQSITSLPCPYLHEKVAEALLFKYEILIGMQQKDPGHPISFLPLQIEHWREKNQRNKICSWDRHNLNYEKDFNG